MIKIDYKAPSVPKMKEFILTKSDDVKKTFAQKCITINEEGKNVINKAEAKKFLYENYKDEIEWVNAPKGGIKKSAVDEIAEWLKL